jgi:hypothetical protein
MGIMNARFPGRCRKCAGDILVGDIIEWIAGKGATHLACPASVPAAQAPQTERTATGVSMTPLIAFLARAADHIKRPKARFLGPDGKSELRISVAGAGSREPGALQIKLAGEWIGRITPEGVAYRLPQNVIELLAKIAEEPAAHAKAYGALMGHCSFCNLPLTDAGSLSVGYGPICAGNYNLPWMSFGVPELKEIPR